ncbi:hypothetical protein CCMSSC00406_0009922 [Pleurotus cornucopiae]|uniref:Uncharacterized protein n=1 Tax=Pleurotus cornucopiae TaxID=5321 RepID=A0ACB7IUG8_PLECO|nr:hypothetical protein CCMSSC00406_0009922 [Pleurotus cornucopiae]
MNTTTNPFARSDSSQIISFAFSSSSILNSHLLGPDRQAYYRVFTDSFGDATHILSQGREIACIRWETRSIKLSSIAGGADGTPISEWIARSPNPEAIGLRYMNFDGANYAWIRKENRYSLYTSLRMAGGRGASKSLRAIASTTIRCFSPERTVATIDWGTRIVDIPDGSVKKQRVSEYLPLDRRRKIRKLSFGDIEYTWIPKKDGFSLYNKKTNQDMANIWTLPGHLPRVEIYCHSVHAGLLDSCVIAAVLFLSKRNLDIDNDHHNV